MRDPAVTITVWRRLGGMNRNMTLGDLLQAVEVERTARGARFNTVVCRPDHVDQWAGFATREQVRLLFAEHGLKLQVDPACPWDHMAFLWIDRPLDEPVAV